MRHELRSLALLLGFLLFFSVRLTGEIPTGGAAHASSPNTWDFPVVQLQGEGGDLLNIAADKAHPEFKKGPPLPYDYAAQIVNNFKGREMPACLEPKGNWFQYHYDCDDYTATFVKEYEACGGENPFGEAFTLKTHLKDSGGRDKYHMMNAIEVQGPIPPALLVDYSDQEKQKLPDRKFPKENLFICAVEPQFPSAGFSDSAIRACWPRLRLDPEYFLPPEAVAALLDVKFTGDKTEDVSAPQRVLRHGDNREDLFCIRRDSEGKCVLDPKASANFKYYTGISIVPSAKKPEAFHPGLASQLAVSYRFDMTTQECGVRCECGTSRAAPFQISVQKKIAFPKGLDRCMTGQLHNLCRASCEEKSALVKSWKAECKRLKIS